MIERFCKKVADLTANPLSLLCAIAFQIIWVIVGSITRMDPYPFVFLLTISNIVQLILIFIIAVAQRLEAAKHDDRHDSIHRRFDQLDKKLTA